MGECWQRQRHGTGSGRINSSQPQTETLGPGAGGEETRTEMGVGCEKSVGWDLRIRHLTLDSSDSLVPTRSAFAGLRLWRIPFAVSQTAQVPGRGGEEKQNGNGD